MTNRLSGTPCKGCRRAISNQAKMLKYVNTDIVFQEIPDEVTLAINISNCPCHCPGCHSPFLWKDVGEPLNADALEKMIGEYGKEITCVSFMGGDAEPESINQLAVYIHRQHPTFKVGWYSGKIRIPECVNKNDFDYLKIGPFLRHLGPLKSKTTNQRMYKKSSNGQFIDITKRFWMH